VFLARSYSVYTLQIFKSKSGVQIESNQEKEDEDKIAILLNKGK
jgi:hypothetical protein